MNYSQLIDEESVTQEAIPSSAIAQPPHNVRLKSWIGCGREKGCLYNDASSLISCLKKCLVGALIFHKSNLEIQFEVGRSEGLKDK